MARQKLEVEVNENTTLNAGDMLAAQSELLEVQKRIKDAESKAGIDKLAAKTAKAKEAYDAAKEEEESARKELEGNPDYARETELKRSIKVARAELRKLQDMLSTGRKRNRKSKKEKQQEAKS